MRGRSPRIGLAVVRAVVDDGPAPVIRVLRMDDLLREERVLGVTTSPDEAAAIVRRWLTALVDDRTTSDSGDDEVTTP